MSWPASAVVTVLLSPMSRSYSARASAECSQAGELLILLSFCDRIIFPIFCALLGTVRCSLLFSPGRRILAIFAAASWARSLRLEQHINWPNCSQGCMVLPPGLALISHCARVKKLSKLHSAHSVKRGDEMKGASIQHVASSRGTD